MHRWFMKFTKELTRIRSKITQKSAKIHKKSTPETPLCPNLDFRSIWGCRWTICVPSWTPFWIPKVIKNRSKTWWIFKTPKKQYSCGFGLQIDSKIRQFWDTFWVPAKKWKLSSRLDESIKITIWRVLKSIFVRPRIQTSLKVVLFNVCLRFLKILGPILRQCW